MYDASDLLLRVGLSDYHPMSGYEAMTMLGIACMYCYLLPVDHGILHQENAQLFHCERMVFSRCKWSWSCHGHGPWSWTRWQPAILYDN